MTSIIDTGFFSADVLRQSQEGRLDPASYRIADAHPGLQEVIHSAWSREPRSRPTLHKVSTALGQVHRQNRSFADNIMRRFVKYSEELEGVVEMRTSELREEMQKVDELLASLLPV